MLKMKIESKVSVESFCMVKSYASCNFSSTVLISLKCLSLVQIEQLFFMAR